MHARRKFREAVGDAPTDSVRILSLMGELFAVETEAKDRGLGADALVAVRQEQSAGTVEEIRCLAGELKPRYSESGTMRSAIGYLENQWDTLVLFLEEGRLPIHNIACEQAIRPVALGRRNWLFTGSPRGGEAAAALYSLVVSCKHSGVEPFEYLQDVLVRICIHPAKGVHELIPRRWHQLREAARLEPLSR